MESFIAICIKPFEPEGISCHAVGQVGRVRQVEGAHAYATGIREDAVALCSLSRKSIRDAIAVGIVDFEDLALAFVNDVVFLARQWGEEAEERGYGRGPQV